MLLCYYVNIIMQQLISRQKLFVSSNSVISDRSRTLLRRCVRNVHRLLARDVFDVAKRRC